VFVGELLEFDGGPAWDPDADFSMSSFLAKFESRG